MDNKVIVFKDNEVELEVNIAPDEDTVWLSLDQISALFLYFLNQNKVLYKNNRKVISDSALVAITLMIAESQPSEKEAMIKVVMNFLHWD